MFNISGSIEMFNTSGSIEIFNILGQIEKFNILTQSKNVETASIFREDERERKEDDGPFGGGR